MKASIATIKADRVHKHMNRARNKSAAYFTSANTAVSRETVLFTFSMTDHTFRVYPLRMGTYKRAVVARVTREIVMSTITASFTNAVNVIV